jgi:protein-S-isoprenylcysteine O-methyltransferase Ste14
MGGQVRCPKSATRSWIVYAGFLAFLASLGAIRVFQIHDVVFAAMLIIACTSFVNFVLDVIFERVHLRPSTGLDWSLNRRSFQRIQIKYMGLLGSIGFVGLIYWLFPEYHGEFYETYWAFLGRLLPVWLITAIPYFFWIDGKMRAPEDGYFQMGQLVLLHFEKIDWPSLSQHLLGWVVKGFFLPLMFTYFTGDIEKFARFDFSTMTSFKVFFDFTYDFIFLIDVGIVTTGYLMSLRIFDTHIRSTEPTLKGWVVALLCYQPFWSLFGRHYAEYASDYGWGTWLQDQPLVYAVWGSVILISYSIYVWSSVMFGCRFSNLTHRGILTNGPYSWTKHPAYISKNIAWWMTSVPFVAQAGGLEAIRRCLLLGLLNFVYYLRAKTEESHLRRDQTYVEYANWIDRVGLFRSR